MKSGQFDRNIATKLFSYIDKDNKGEISVQDFVKGYIFLEEDIKKTNCNKNIICNYICIEHF